MLSGCTFRARALGEGEVTDRPIGNQLKLSHERGWGIWQLSAVDLLAQSQSGSSGSEWHSLQTELFGWLQVSFQFSHNRSIHDFLTVSLCVEDAARVPVCGALERVMFFVMAEGLGIGSKLLIVMALSSCRQR